MGEAHTAVAWRQNRVHAEPMLSARHLTSDGTTALCGTRLPLDRRGVELLSVQEMAELAECKHCAALNPGRF